MADCAGALVPAAVWGERRIRQACLCSSASEGMRMKARQIHEDEVLRTEELFAAAFSLPMKSAAYEKVKDIPDVHERALAFAKERRENPTSREDEQILNRYGAFTDDGEMTAAVFATEYQMKLGDSLVKMAGIGGVSSLPQARKQGGIRSIFNVLLKDQYEKGCVLSYLYPFSTSFYRRFGYEQGVVKSDYTLRLEPLRALPFPEGRTVLIDELNRTEVLPDIRRLDEEWVRRYNASTVRSDYEYRFVHEADPYRGKNGVQEYLYVTYDTDGKADGYMSYMPLSAGREEPGLAPGERFIRVVRFVVEGRNACMRLLHLLSGLAADFERAALRVPGDLPIDSFLPEIRFGNCMRSDCCDGMIRVVNAKEALRCARYEGSGMLRLNVRDEQIKENCGCFEVEYRDGKAAEIRKSGAEDPEEAILSPGELGSFLLFGNTWFPVPKSGRKLPEGVIAKQCGWIGDYF